MPPRRKPSLKRCLALFAALVLLIPVGAVLTLRWLDPPTTSVMLQWELGAWWRGDPATLQHRWVDLHAIAPAMRLAVVAAEDQKFPRHFGFDLDSIADALEESAQGGRLRGASTITQQTAKNLFLWHGRSFVRKGLEAGGTVLLEGLWPKRRILEVYLNVAEFGEGIYGVEAAARAHFGKPAARLTRAEAVLLAAVLPSPTRLDPRDPSAYLRERQAWILRQMTQLGPRYVAFD
jgi:monofunctional biosynthetic peptidoglycan transglycosylase